MESRPIDGVRCRHEYRRSDRDAGLCSYKIVLLVGGNDMEIKIRACPFCGGTARRKIDRYYLAYVCQCDTCSARTGFYDSPIDAIRAWNTRSKPNIAGGSDNG